MRINKIAAGSLLSVVTTGAVVAATMTPAGALGFGVGKATPDTNLVNGQTVSMAVSGFPASDVGKTMYAFQCSSQALATQDLSYCDTHSADTNNTGTFVAAGAGAAGSLQFKVLAGSSFRAGSDTTAGNSAAACGFNAAPCYLVVSDTATQETSTTVAFDTLKFKDTRAATKTTVKAPKTAKAGKKAKIVVTTKGASGGKLVVKDGHKTLKKVAEPASGKVTVVDKHLKKGTHKITASYSGSSTAQPSKGKATIKVKK